MPVTIKEGLMKYKDPVSGNYVAINAVESGSFGTIAPSYSDLTFPVSAGQKCYHEGSLYSANQEISTSESWTAAHWTEIVLTDVMIKDVQLGGTSILNNGVANIPPTGSSVSGYCRIDSSYGVNANAYGRLYTVKADASAVKAGTHQYDPIVPYNQDAAAFYGLAKAAGDSTQSASSNAVGTYTPDALAKIQSMLGIDTILGNIETLLAAI